MSCGNQMATTTPLYDAKDTDSVSGLCWDRSTLRVGRDRGRNEWVRSLLAVTISGVTVGSQDQNVWNG